MREEGGRERENSEYNGKGKKARRNTFKPVLIQVSSPQRERQRFSKSILRVSLKLKM